MIRKDVKNINIDYTNNNNEEVTNVSDNISNQNLNNYANYNSSEVEIVNFSLEDNSNNNDNLQDIDGLIKTNNDNFENITKLKKQMDKEYETLQKQYDDAFSIKNEKIWYENGEIMSNGDKPMTPQEYENLLLGNYSQMYTDANIVEAFYNDKEWQEKIRTYTDTYNEIFKKLTNSDKTEDEYKENMQKIKNDSLMLSSAQYALKQELQKLKIAKEEENITNSQEYIKWLLNGSLSDEKLEEKYNEYQEQYLRIYDVPDLAYQLQENYNPLLFCEYAKSLANKEGLDISDVINRQVVVYQQDFSKMYENYKVMTQEEIQIYSYLFENEGRASADKYIDKKQDELNQRIGYNLAQKEIKELSLDDEGEIQENICNTLNVGTDGLSDGINLFFKGLENAVINDENLSVSEYKIAYYLQYLQKQTKILDNVYQVGMSTGNMLPSVTASFLASLVAPELAPKVGQLLMGASAYGNSKHEALVNGHTTMTSILYGLLSAGSEVLTEKMGGVLGLADNPSTSFIVRMLQEGNEEFLQSYLMAGIDAVLLNKPVNLDELTDEAIKSFLMGAIVAGNLNAYSGALGGLSLVINNQKININNEQLNQVIEQINKNSDLDLKDLIEKCSKTEANISIENIDDIINSSILKGYMSFFEQFPAGRNGANQSIVEADMKVPERANLVLDIIKSYFPNMSQQDKIKLATDMNGSITGGICDYAATINTIMIYFQNNPDLFKQTFGFPLTRKNQTGLTLPNDDLLLTDFYCWMNKNNMVKNVDGKDVYTPKYKIKLGTSYFEGNNVQTIEDYLKSKGLNINTTNKGIYNNFPVAPWQVNNNIPDAEFNQTVINKIADGLKKGSVLLTLNPTLNNLKNGNNESTPDKVKFYIPALNKTVLCGEGHTVSVIGIQDENHILVESWGHICSLDLDELKNTNIGINAITINGGN